jgi:hypothetical protein
LLVVAELLVLLVKGWMGGASTLGSIANWKYPLKSITLPAMRNRDMPKINEERRMQQALGAGFIYQVQKSQNKEILPTGRPPYFT